MALTLFEGAVVELRPFSGAEPLEIATYYRLGEPSQRIVVKCATKDVVVDTDESPFFRVGSKVKIFVEDFEVGNRIVLLENADVNQYGQRNRPATSANWP